MKLVQLTPQLLTENIHNSEIYLNKIVHPTINSKSWMTKWQDIVSRYLRNSETRRCLYETISE